MEYKKCLTCGYLFPRMRQRPSQWYNRKYCSLKCSKKKVPWNKDIPRTEKTKQKLRIKCLERFKDGMLQETKDKISKSNKGKHNRPHSEQTKQKLRVNALERFKDGMLQETKDKISKANKGRKLPKTKEWQDNLTKSLKGKKPWNKNIPRTEKTKEKLRNAQIKNVEIQRFNGLPLIPCIGKYETQILNDFENCFGYKVLRQYRVIGYFLDGYIPELNLVIEIDEPFHKNEKQQKKDNLRQLNIEKELGCKFLRIGV